jgi:hypothetical protein
MKLSETSVSALIVIFGFAVIAIFTWALYIIDVKADTNLKYSPSNYERIEK